MAWVLPIHTKDCTNRKGGMAKGDKVVASIRKGAASHSTTFQHPVLKHHKVSFAF
jgi:hypothetical protein